MISPNLHFLGDFLRRIEIFLAAILLCAAAMADENPTPPPLLLAKKYAPGINLADYWVSEKLDGVRAYWDGQKLISRNGHTFASPNWFTEKFPPTPMDGELWIGRRQFENTVSVVRRHRPHEGWRRIKFMAFDLPSSAEIFDRRLAELQRIVKDADSEFLAAVAQERIADEDSLAKKLDAIVAVGGEGLMLHKGDSIYRGGRSGDLLKLKKHDDAEAVVIAHHPGKGKFTDLLGAITVENSDGIQFRIGSGFTVEERRNPPKIGSVITYKFYGLTQKGKPRFPVFLRGRAESNIQ